jgi:hypothetical protein
MSAATITAGVLALFLSTILRFVLHKGITLRDRIVKSITLPSRENPDDLYLLIGQLMGILWIGISIFLAKTSQWFSSSVFGVFLEPFFYFLPFIIVGLALKLMAQSGKKK